MAAGLVVPVSGPYTGTFGGLPFGTLSDDGYEVQATIQGQEVNATDAYGMTLVEGIYRGQNWRLRLRGLEWKTGLLAVLQTFGQTGAVGTLTPYLANIGDRFTKFALGTVLTAILANPPTTPQSISAVNCNIAPNQQSSFMMTSKVRELPLELVLFPYSAIVGSGTFNVPFTSV